MIILDATTKSLQIKLGGTITTNQLPFSASYIDTTGTATTPGEQDGASNNTTAVNVISAPASSTQRLVKGISIQNADTVSAKVTVIYNNNSTLRNVFIATLAAGDQLIYEDGSGWSTIDTNGNLKTSSGGGSGGTVTSVSVASANGFAGTVATATTTPAITISTSITGVLKGNGTAIAAATAGTDYQAPITLTTTGTSGAATLSSNTLNIPQYAGATYAAGTGLTLTTGTFSVNTSQNIATLSNLTSNGLIRTSGGTGALSIATSGTDYSVGTSALSTGILKSTTTTGALSIAVAGDFPTLNQNTTGSAATLTTSRSIYGNSFDGSAALTQVIASTYGGTGNGFTKLSGPASTEKTFTLPNASAAVLTDNAAVTVAQGGTGLGSLTANNVILGNGTSTPGFVAPGTSGNVLTSNGTTWTSAASGGSSVKQLVRASYSGVATGTTVIPYDDTIPQKTEGDQYMTLSITPTSASSILVIEVLAQVTNTADIRCILALFQDSTSNALAAMVNSGTGVNYPIELFLSHYMTAGTTSSTTFNVRIGGQSAGTTTFNGISSARRLGGAQECYIMITEYAA